MLSNPPTSRAQSSHCPCKSAGRSNRSGQCSASPALLFQIRSRLHKSPNSMCSRRKRNMKREHLLRTQLLPSLEKQGGSYCEVPLTSETKFLHQCAASGRGVRQLGFTNVSFTVCTFWREPVYFAVGDAATSLVASTPPSPEFVTVNPMVTV